MIYIVYIIYSIHSRVRSTLLFRESLYAVFCEIRESKLSFC